MSQKPEAVQHILADWQLDALLLTRRDNIAWLTEGASYYVVERAETGVASLLITPERVLLLAPENEMPRILAEEPLPFACETYSYPWFDSLARALAPHRPARVGSDTPLASTVDISHRMPALRQGLNEKEKQRFRELGREAALIVEEVARGCYAGISEREVEARLAQKCLARGIRPMCTLVAADDRIALYKHPVPGSSRLVSKMLITLGAERFGLHVSLTRMVHIGEPDAELRQRIRALADIHADMLSAIQPGKSWQTFFSQIQQAYRRHGWPDGWRDHHQGGPAGYGCRDWIVTPDTAGWMAADTAHAWNPTLSGVKSEDTLLITEQGSEWLTRSGNWPLIDVVRAGQRWQLADWLILPLSS